MIQAFPLVSIVVPVFNAQNYLDSGIGSVIQQTWSNWELLLVNDGSTDNSAALCRKYAAEDSRIRFINKANEGVSATRNLGIEESKGDYLVFMDSDDWLAENALELSMQKMLAEQADLVLFGWKKTFKEKEIPETALVEWGNAIEQGGAPWLKRRSVGLIEEELKNPVKTDLFNTPWAKLIAAPLIKQTGLRFQSRKEVGMEDVLFSIGLYQQCKKPVLLPEYLYYYRQDNASSLSRKDTDFLAEKFENLFLAIKGYSLSNVQQKALENRIACSIINIGLSICARDGRYSISRQLKEMKKLLNAPTYSDALRKFSIQTMPLYWKMFFLLAKWGQATLLVMYINLIQKLR
ncbi:hypothetical protein MASR2M44_14320 [Bacteroidota bacterium]